MQTSKRSWRNAHEQDWQYDEWFEVPHFESACAAVNEAELLVDECRIDQHPFFVLAATSRTVLQAWVSQEVVVTNPFSQLLLDLGARIRNVHVRSMVVRVAAAEHGPVRRRIAHHAHPWLLHQLRSNVGLTVDDVRVLPETELFLNIIAEECSRTILSAVGALGMGSERLLIPEYAAIKAAFDSCWPDAEYRRFLDANINEDTAHAALMADVASALISSDEDAADFIEGARSGVDARIKYYDALVSRFRSAVNRSF